MSATPRPWTILHPTPECLGMRLEVRDANKQLIHVQYHPDELEIETWLHIVKAVNTFDGAKAALADAISYFEDAERLLAIRDHVDLSDSLRIGKNRAKAVLAKLEGA